MKKTSFLILHVALIAVCTWMAAHAIDTQLPVKVPQLRPAKGRITNHVSFDQIHNITDADVENRGLRIDLKDPSIHGTIYTGLFPFEFGKADYWHTAYFWKARLEAGKGFLPFKRFFEDWFNINRWKYDPVTTDPSDLSKVHSLAYRFDLLRKGERWEHLGFYDGVVSFRQSGERFFKNLTIVEGPLVATVTSDDPDSTAVVLRTDEACHCTAKVLPAKQIRKLIKRRRRDDVRIRPRSFDATREATVHEVNMPGLKPNTEYYYWVECEASSGERTASYPALFRTAPKPGKGTVVFAFTSDTQESTGGGERNYAGCDLHSLKRIVADAYRRGAEFLMFGGDLVTGYTSDVNDFRLQLRGWKQAMKGFWGARPVYSCIGNHESLMNCYEESARKQVRLDKWPYDTQSAEALFAEELCNPRNGPKPSDARRPTYRENVFKFQYGPVLVMALNNNYWWSNRPHKFGGSPVGYMFEDQLVWIENVLAQAESDPTVKYVVLFAHQSVFPRNARATTMWHRGDNRVRAWTYTDGALLEEKRGIIQVRNRFWKAVSGCRKVAAVFTGHEHEYHKTLVTDRTPVGLFPRDDADGDGKLDRYSPNPDFKYPTWHFTGGSAGGLYHSLGDAPWQPELVTLQRGYVLLKADRKRISLKFITVHGTVMDRIDNLMQSKKGFQRRRKAYRIPSNPPGRTSFSSRK